MKPKQIFLIVFAHRYIATVVFLAMLVIGVVLTFLTPKTYVASTDLLVDARIDPIAGTQSTQQGNYIATQIAIIQSERVAVGVVNKLMLKDSPKWQELWQSSTNGKVPFDSFAANLIRKGMEVEPPKGTNVIRLNFEGSDPKFVTDAANAFASTYLSLNVNLRVEPAKQYAEWFDDRVKTLRQNVEDAQAKLSAYQRKKGIVGTDQKADQETQRLDQLTSQLVAVQGENIAMTSRQKMSGGELSPDVQASMAVQGIKSELARTEAKLSEVSLTLGPNHPQRQQLEGQVVVLRKQLDEEMRRVSGGTNTAQTTASMRESELRGVIAAQKGRVMALRQQQDEMSVLVQDVEAAKRTYDSVLQRSNQLNLEKQSDQADVTVLTLASEPTSPSKPNMLKYLSGSLLAALAAAFASAFGLEMLDRRVRVVGDIKMADVPVLGIIERRSDKYTLEERLTLSKKFFTQRKERKEIIAASRLGSL
jgi:chain length determinant protein EpsF